MFITPLTYRMIYVMVLDIINNLYYIYYNNYKGFREIFLILFNNYLIIKRAFTIDELIKATTQVSKSWFKT